MRRKFFTILLLVFLTVPVVFAFASPLAAQPEDTDTVKEITPAEIHKSPDNGVITANNNRILYWVQITDQHLNMEHLELIENFERFCNSTLPVINPAFILSTGDQVDGMELPRKQRGQDPEEYETFQRIVDESGFADRWINLIGNHEIFDSYNRSNFYTYLGNYSMADLNVSTDFGDYRFILFDSSHRIGLKNPFNLWGEMLQEELDILEEWLEERPPSDFNHTFLAGHHPIHHISSERSSSGRNFRDLVPRTQATAYLTGHLHLEPTYARMDGVMELMAQSFKDQYGYRILTLDNDLFSVSEQNLDQWPAVAITTPIDVHFYDETQALDQLRELNQIRTLIFDPGDITNTEVYINGDLVGSLEAQGENLWTLDVDMEAYSTGDHTLQIVVNSTSGDTIEEITFNLSDFSVRPFTGWFRYAIEWPIWTIAVVGIGLFIFLGFSSFILPKIAYGFHREYFDSVDLEKFEETFPNAGVRLLLKSFFQAAKMPPSLSLPVLLIPLYVFVGPIVVAPVIHNDWGFLMLGGMFVGDIRILTLYSYLYMVILCIGFYFFQMYIIRSYKNDVGITGRIPLVLAMLIFLIYCYFVVAYFGIGVLFLNPAFWFFSLIIYYYMRKIEIDPRKEK